MPVPRGPDNDLWYHCSEVEDMLEKKREEAQLQGKRIMAEKILWVIRRHPTHCAPHALWRNSLIEELERRYGDL